MSARLGAASTLDELERLVDGCVRCDLHQRRNSIVFGKGNPGAELCFVGEGPGGEEDRQGKPFVGPAGQLLDKIIAAMTLAPEEVYICNVVKCRPPRNRTPRPEERAACGPFLERQLELVRPSVVVALGTTAAQYLLKTDEPLRELRGRFHQRGPFVVMPTYHPAYLLRESSAKRLVWNDMKMVMERLGLRR